MGIENIHTTITTVEQPPVDRKSDMRERQMAGEFGNTFRRWKTIEELENSDYRGSLWLSQSKEASGKREHGIPFSDIKERYDAWVAEGIDPKYIQINEAPPPGSRTFNAEVLDAPNGLIVFYSTEKVTHDVAMKNPLHAVGMQAKELLRKYMDESSYADLEVLLEQYPNHAIELHCFNQNVGTIPHRNTIIGEVRTY